MALIKGKQIATGSDGIATANIVDGALSADASGRAKMASSFFDNTTTVSAKFAASSIGLDRLEENVIQADGGQAFTADQSMGSNKLTSLATPTADSDAATKAYVDSVATGLDPKGSVRVATDAALPAYTQAGSGVGATLTANAVGVLTVDGVATVLNDRILVKDQGSGTHADNGIYKVTTEGTAGVAFVLTRATDADADAEVTAGMYCFAAEGSANADIGFILTTNDPITVDTTALSFTEFTGVASITYETVGNITTVNGGDSAAAGTNNTTARGDHQHAVATAAAGTIQPDDSAAEGSSTSLARADHTHAIAAAVAGAVAAGDTAAEGSSTSFARADHVHSVATAAAGTIEPDDAAADGVATSFSRSDHQHAIATAVAGAVQIGDSAAEGSATSFARSDHTHSVASAAPSAVGTSNSEGSAATFSRTDHVHDSPAPTTSDKALTASATSSDGDAATASTVTATPALDCYVGVRVNGLHYEVGDGVKTKDCYFSADAGTTARSISAIASGDGLYWNGSIAGFQLAATDKIDLDYIV